MEPIADAARQACRAWFTGEPMGRSMSDLADQLARIDKGQTYGQADSKARERADGQAPRHGAGHSGRIAATSTGRNRPEGSA